VVHRSGLRPRERSSRARFLRRVPYRSEGRAGGDCKTAGRPNGIALSPDGRTLYVTNSDEHNVRAYDIARNGAASNERVVISGIEGVPDGMKVDERVICTWPPGSCSSSAPPGSLSARFNSMTRHRTRVRWAGDGSVVRYSANHRVSCASRCEGSHALDERYRLTAAIPTARFWASAH